MKHWLTAVACIVALTSLAAQTTTQNPPDKKPLSKELTSLQGSWVITEANGQSVSSGASTLTITGDQYIGTSSGSPDEHGTIALDTSKTPIALTFSIKDGDDAGKVQYGALQIGDGTLTLKLGAPGGTDRPTDLAVSDGFRTLSAVKRKLSSTD
jgi:uncharacterized protein (TIGR03067 family)